MRNYFLIAFSLIILAAGNEVYAASSKLVLYTEETIIVEDEYGEYEETQQTMVHTIEDEGTYPVDLNKEYGAYLVSDLAVNFPEGYLYRINTEGVREFVSPVGGYDSIVWGEAGNYEIDFYDTEPPILGIQGAWDYFQSLFSFISVTYAQNPEFFLETIHFTITDENAVAECCSSVVFLPGIKGSVLKTEDDTLWPPTVWSTDVMQLAINEDGESEEEIYVDGMLSTFYGTPVYGPFGSFMNTLVADGTIADWKPLPYDWRFSPERILQGGVKTEDGVVDLIDQIEAIAADSHTGQVTIIAHSMGGLMGKAIIKELQDQGKDNLIDSFVMVGSPQLGTPQAITSLLHGQGESILAGQIVDSAVSRLVAQNMGSSYNLLPSAEYFEEVVDPVITFKENDWYTSDWVTEWGTSLDIYDEYVEFVTGEGVERTDPLNGDLSRPEILQTELIEEAEAFHNEFDSYVFPPHIRVVQVAGWGLETVKSVLYRSRHLILPAYEPNFTVEGDGTVVYPSAISSKGEEYFLNLDLYREQNGNLASHKDLLNVLSVQKLITQLIKEQSAEDIAFITDSKPILSNIQTKLLVSSHSPVLLGVYDSEGNFTGINTSNLHIEQEIPGSSFIEFGESQYVFLPKVGTYTFYYYGTGNGSTTIEIETFANDVRTHIATYTDMSTMLNTIASFDLDSSSPQDTQIKLDENGDGIIDKVVNADGTELSLDELIHFLKTTIASLDIRQVAKKSLLSKVVLLEQLITIKNEKLRTFSVNLNINILKLEIELLRKNKKISQQDAVLLLDILNQIKEQI